MNVGQRIRSERQRLELTQAKLAGLVGVGVDVISKYERNVMRPSVETLRKLAREFGLSMDDLVENRSAA